MAHFGSFLRAQDSPFMQYHTVQSTVVWRLHRITHRYSVVSI